MATAYYGNQGFQTLLANNLQEIVHSLVDPHIFFLQTSQTAAIMNGRKMVKVKTKMEDTNPAMISPSRERRQLGSHMSETKQKQHNNNNKNNENTTINDQVLLQFIYFRIESMELECMTLFMMVLSYLYLQIYKNI